MAEDARVLRRFAEIEGGVAMAAGRFVIQCPYGRADLRRAWLEGYLRSAVTAWASGNRSLAGFHVEQQRAAHWRDVELDLAAVAKEMTPRPRWAVVAALLGRTALAVRRQASSLGRKVAGPDLTRAAGVGPAAGGARMT